MSLHRRDLLGLAVVAAMVVASVVTYPDLPARLAIHFDAAGEPDSFVGKPVALGLLPLFALGVVALFRVLPTLDPLGENVQEFQRSYDLVAVTTVGVLAYVHGLVLVWNLGYEVAIGQALAPVLAVTYYVLGVVVENARQNWFVGIRTPWTLSSEEVWKRTHERSGVLFKLAGLGALLAVPYPEALLYVAVLPVVVVALGTSAYSYLVYRRVAGT